MKLGASGWRQLFSVTHPIGLIIVNQTAVEAGMRIEVGSTAAILS